MFLASITVIHMGLSMHEMYDEHESDWSVGEHKVNQQEIKNGSLTRMAVG